MVLADGQYKHGAGCCLGIVRMGINEQYLGTRTSNVQFTPAVCMQCLLLGDDVCGNGSKGFPSAPPDDVSRASSGCAKVDHPV